MFDRRLMSLKKSKEEVLALEERVLKKDRVPKLERYASAAEEPKQNVTVNYEPRELGTVRKVLTEKEGHGLD